MMKRYFYCQFMVVIPLIYLITIYGITGCQSSENISRTYPDGDILATPTEYKIIITSETMHKPDQDRFIPMLEWNEDTLDNSLASDVVNTIMTENQPEEDFIICSPLSSVQRENLREVISAPYAPPPPGHDERHHGVDFAYYRRNGRMSIAGDSLQSVLDGKIAAVIMDRYPYGNALIVESYGQDMPIELTGFLKMRKHESLYLMYAHMQEISLMKSGDIIKHCQVLGSVGSSGNAGVAHLHLEVRIGPSYHEFGSMAYYIPTASNAERETYRLWRTSGVFNHLNPIDLLMWGLILNEIPIIPP